MCAACSPSEDNPVVVLNTDVGIIEITVYPNKAPISAADFLKHVDGGYYDGQGFYRVVRPDNDPRNMGMSLICLLYTSPSPRDRQKSRMPSSA